jgi:SAM-dependent methyltransferase
MDEYRIRLTNNYERAVFLKGDVVHARESARYQWAAKNILGTKILDIGCSTGYGIQFMPSHIQYTGLDYDPTIVQVAKEQNWNKFLNYISCNFIQGDINQIELEQYDTIIAFEIIEHMDNGLEVLEKLKKHCKRLLFTTPHNEPKGFWGEHHKLHGLNESHFKGFDFEYTNEFGLITKYMVPVSPSNQFNLLMGKWNKEKILCCLPTKGRYFTTLPLVIEAIANQTKKPDKLIIFDDNEEPQDMRKEFLYQHLFWLLNSKKIEWEWLFAGKKGQHHIHQTANTMAAQTGYTWVWRCDDDAIPEPNVLEVLSHYCDDSVGAIGGSVINPPNMPTFLESTGLIENIDVEPNIQWGMIKEPKQVEHLYSTFLYRAGVHDFNLGLSRVAHREETLFSHGLHRKGYKLLVVPNAITWHLKNPQGGIRDGAKQEMFEHDERIYRNILRLAQKTIIVLDSGLGDHIVFSKVLSDIPNPVVFGCYPEVIPCKSIAEARDLFGDIDQWNIYKKMADWGWTGSLEDAYRKLYL